MILSVTCVFVVLWYHLYLSGKGSGFEYQQSFLFLKKICQWIQRIQWKHLGKTQWWRLPSSISNVWMFVQFVIDFTICTHDTHMFNESCSYRNHTGFPLSFHLIFRGLYGNATPVCVEVRVTTIGFTICTYTHPGHTEAERLHLNRNYIVIPLVIMAHRPKTLIFYDGQKLSLCHQSFIKSVSAWVFQYWDIIGFLLI